MLLNYIKLSLRLLARNPFFTFINVAGLSIGFAVFIVLWQHASYELRSDQFHKDYDRIYRLYCDFYFGEGESWKHYIYSTLPPVLTTTAIEKYNEVESATRLIHQRNFDAVRWQGPQSDTAGYSELSRDVVLTYIDQKNERHSFKETRSAYADPNFFEFFAIRLLEGHPHYVLKNPDAVVLSQSTAIKYFGRKNPLGRTLLLNGGDSFTVTGVFQDTPHNSHLTFDLLFSTARLAKANESTNPFQETAVSYFKLHSKANIPKLEIAFAKEIDLNWPNIKASFKGSSYTFHLQPLKDVPFHIFENDAYTPKAKLKLQTFMIVGIIVLVMGWINYLNLKLSKQTGRLKELATRKTAGARMTDFIKQFLVESITINTISILVALTVVQLLRLPLEVYFQFYMPDWSEFDHGTLYVFIMVMAIGILVAALHPAFILWKMSIQAALRRGDRTSEGSYFVRVSPIVQFISAITLIIWLVVVSSQVDFLIKKSWGLNRDRVVIVDLPRGEGAEIIKIESLKNQLLALSDIEDVALSITVAGDVLRNRMKLKSVDVNNTIISKSDGGVDERFVPFYNLKILAGRNFISGNSADNNAIILSKDAAKNLGFDPEAAIGKIVMVEKYPWKQVMSKAEIIGVIEDHLYSPLYMETFLSDANVGTTLTFGDHLRPSSQQARMSIRLKEPETTIDEIGNKFNEIFPEEIFHWYYLDQHMNGHYQNEKMARNQITLFTLIAIGIGCLGLLGMISNKAVSKTKEIGIRKILGAKLYQICQMLLNSTIRQIALAAMIGIPLAYYLTQQYFQKFTERIELEWWHFVLPIVVLVMILFSTIASVLWKAARNNPVDALKYE